MLCVLKSCPAFSWNLNECKDHVYNMAEPWLLFMCLSLHNVHVSVMDSHFHMQVHCQSWLNLVAWHDYVFAIVKPRCMFVCLSQIMNRQWFYFVSYFSAYCHWGNLVMTTHRWLFLLNSLWLSDKQHVILYTCVKLTWCICRPWY